MVWCSIPYVVGCVWCRQFGVCVGCHSLLCSCGLLLYNICLGCVLITFRDVAFFYCIVGWFCILRGEQPRIMKSAGKKLARGDVSPFFPIARTGFFFWFWTENPIRACRVLPCAGLEKLNVVYSLLGKISLYIFKPRRYFEGSTC